jgi:MFS family permease
MDTQNTPIHVRLWNRDFWMLAFAELLVSMAVYVQFFYIYRIMLAWDMNAREMATVTAAFGIGLFCLGGFCSYLVQRKRRNRVCLNCMLLLAICFSLPYLITSFGGNLTYEWLAGIRLASGAAFGLAQMVLASTLIIDTTEADQRTEANYATAWFGRFAVSLGPVAALVTYSFAGLHTMAWTALALDAVAVLLIFLVDFPFRTPEDNVRVFSLDRFLLPESWMLFINLLLITSVIGLILSLQLTNMSFFAMMMIGFLLAILAEKHVFVNAELMSETVCGLILMGFALLLMLSNQGQTATVPILVGLAAGLIGSRFLLFFIKLSQHCKRGTSQSSYFLAWESGITLGLALGFWAGYSTRHIMLIALAIDAISLLLYVAFTHKWYIKHKNR